MSQLTVMCLFDRAHIGFIKACYLAQLALIQRNIRDLRMLLDLMVWKKVTPSREHFVHYFLGLKRNEGVKT